jgi:hypothetical protein
VAVSGGKGSREGAPERRVKKSFSRLQRILISLNVLVMVLVAAAILGGVWYLASMPQFRMRWDLTKEQSFTLTRGTKDILNALEKEVDVILVFEAGGFDLTGRLEAERRTAGYTLDLLKEYEIHSGGMIRVEDLDRVRDNLRVKEVFDELGVREVNVVIVKSGSSRKVLYPDDLADIDQGRVNPGTGVVKRAEIVSYKAEAALTAAVIEVTEEKKPLACVLAGRGEAQVGDTNSEGLSIAVTSLENNNFEVRELNLAVEKYIPDECDVLVIAGPRDDYSGEETAEITRYLQAGGNAFIALDPFSSRSLDAELLPAFGVALERTLTLRDIPDVRGGRDREVKLTLPVENLSRDSRITRPLAENDYMILCFRAGALVPAPGLDNLSIEGLMRTDTETWGDVLPPGGGVGDFTFDSVSEKKEPRLLGLSCTGQGAFDGARLVLFAETFFYTNLGVQRGGRGNLLLFTNSVNWLASREVQLEIGPKYPYESRVELFPGEYSRIGFYVLLVIPAAAALLGIVVWWFRRR